MRVEGLSLAYFISSKIKGELMDMFQWVFVSIISICVGVGAAFPQLFTFKDN